MEKQYYALTELTERWDFCLHDALYLAENGLCRFWVNLPETNGIRFEKAENNGLAYELPIETCKVGGLLSLMTEDVRQLIIYKTAKISRLSCPSDGTYFIRLGEAAELTADDMVMMCKDKLRLEKELGFLTRRPKSKPPTSATILTTFLLKNCRTATLSSVTTARTIPTALCSRKSSNSFMTRLWTGGFGFMAKRF